MHTKIEWSTITIAQQYPLHINTACKKIPIAYRKPIPHNLFQIDTHCRLTPISHSYFLKKYICIQTTLTILYIFINMIGDMRAPSYPFTGERGAKSLAFEFFHWGAMFSWGATDLVWLFPLGCFFQEEWSSLEDCLFHNE